ncbi:MAG TPA: DUF503 domain-containing protein [Polyangiaceae bacterium]
MFVGVARLVLSIPGARSLKDRRRVVRSLKERIAANLRVSIAEIGDLERYQVATLGLAVVSNDSARCSALLSKGIAMARTARDALLADVATEIVTFGDGGSGIRGGIEQALASDTGAYPYDDEDDDS